MDNFKEALIQFGHSNPSLFPNDAANSYPMLIEECFHQFFWDFQTPNHPPYAAMIYRAIRESNKKGGSSEKSISKFIKKEYADLPWAHSTLLKHHLEKLCDRKEICTTPKQCYLLAGPSKKEKNQPGSSSRSHKKCKKKEKSGSETGVRKRKRKQRLKSKKKSSKRLAIYEDTKLRLLDESSLKQTNDELKHTLEAKIQVQQKNEVGQESPHDNSSCINLEQVQTKMNPEELQPDLNPILHKRVCTRSRSNTISIKDKPDIVEHLEKNAKPQQISTLEKPLIELLKPISPDDETQVQDLKDQQSENSTGEVKPNYKLRGRHPKPTKKGNVGNEKIQPKYKCHGEHKKSRKSSRNLSCSKS